MSKQKKSSPAWKRVLKRHWKLFFVVFFLLGGLGNIGNEIAPVILGCVLAVAFLCWWAILLWRKRREEIEAAEKKKRADEERRLRLASIRERTNSSMESSISPSRRSDTEITERSEADASAFSFQIEFDGIKFDDGENTSNHSFKKDVLQKTAINNGKAIAQTTDYVVLDVETTGIDRKNDRMVEIAILEISNGNIVDQYQTLVNPGIPISPGAYQVHGISDADVASAPKAEHIAAEIADRLRGKPVVGHSVTFDLDFVEEAFRDAGITEKLSYIDTLSFSRKLFRHFLNTGFKSCFLC